jgi:hypothetical protein
MATEQEAPDEVVELAKLADAALLHIKDSTDHDALDSALQSALEAARVFRAQLDLTGFATGACLLAMESLYRATLGVQPMLAVETIDRVVEAAEAGDEPTDSVTRAGDLWALSFMIAQSLIHSLDTAYRRAFESKETPWQFK